jgi:hypothetical protein
MAQGILLGRVTALCPALGVGGEFLNRRSEVRVLSGPPISFCDSLFSMG